VAAFGGSKQEERRNGIGIINMIFIAEAPFLCMVLTIPW
jgi:hypothetical protein